MCWEETEETVIHEDISQWGTAEGKTNIFCLWGLTLYGEILNTRHLLGEICKEIYITIAGDTTNKRYMARNAK